MKIRTCLILICALGVGTAVNAQDDIELTQDWGEGDGLYTYSGCTSDVSGIDDTTYTFTEESVIAGLGVQFEATISAQSDGKHRICVTARELSQETLPAGAGNILIATLAVGTTHLPIIMDTGYFVRVSGSQGGVAYGDYMLHRPWPRDDSGDHISQEFQISATPDEGYKFVEWTASSEALLACIDAPSSCQTDVELPGPSAFGEVNGSFTAVFAVCTDITLDFSYLPSNQACVRDWDFLVSGGWASEEDVFSVDQGVLTLNTLGKGIDVVSAGGGASYGYDGIDPEEPFKLSFRARCLQEETAGMTGTPQTFYVSARANNRVFGVVLGVDSLAVGSGGDGNRYWKVIPFNNSQFHDYVIHASPEFDYYTLTVDGTDVFVGYAEHVPGNRIAFGDGSSSGNVHAEMTSLTFSQPAAAPVRSVFWEFDGNYETTPSSAWNGIEYGSVDFVPSILGQAASFDGGYLPDVGLPEEQVDHVESQKKAPNTDFFGGLSIMGWVRIDPLADGWPGGIGAFLSHRSTATATMGGYSFVWSSVNQSIALSLADNGWGGMYGNSNANAVTAGEWTHVGATYDGSIFPYGVNPTGIQLYVNGSAVSTSIAITGSSGRFIGLHSGAKLPIRIGANNADSAKHAGGYLGLIDHISLWKGEITAAEVYDDFSATSNQPPVSNPGPDQPVAVGDIVYLDGSGSYDPDGDPIGFSWMLQTPEGSTAELDAVDSQAPSFYVDIEGTYVANLVVNDGAVNSEPKSVTITAATLEEAVAQVQEDMEVILSDIPVDNLEGQNAADVLIKDIDRAMTMAARGKYTSALNKLNNNILKRTDGCITIGSPDDDDWILTCEDQAIVYPLVMRSIELVERMKE